jgi:signal peptidase I
VSGEAARRPGARGDLRLAATVVLVVGLLLSVQLWLVKPYRIPSASMVPTLAVGQRILVSRFNYHLSDPGIGDIVVFHPPAGADMAGEGCGDRRAGGGTKRPCDEATPKESDETFVKRIVAGPGDTLSIRGGHPVVNGVEAKEGFTKPCDGGTSCNMPEEITVPPDHYFMMGDNRGASDDSRFWGPVPRDWIIGQAFFTYWPPDRIGIP